MSSENSTDVIDILNDRCDKLEREVVIIRDTLLSLKKSISKESESSSSDSITYAEWDFTPEGSYKSKSFSSPIGRKKGKK